MAHRSSLAWSRAICCGDSFPELGTIFCGIRCAHAVWADAKTGEFFAPVNEMLPLEGSGKFATPCERMHRANARPWLARPPVVELDPDGVPPDPHAATAIEHAAAKIRARNRVIGRLYRWRPNTDVTARVGTLAPSRVRSVAVLQPRVGGAAPDEAQAAFGGAGVRPWRRITATTAARLGGPPAVAARTSLISRK